LIYTSSRIYAGYATTSLNPEPYAYQSAFAVKWLIQEARHTIRGRPESQPWLGWGPYLWADGLEPRGTHPSTSGRQKVAQMLLDFFKTDPTAKGWFLAP
jgi:hypothetical protein